MNAVTLAELKEIISPDSERRHREMMAATIVAALVVKGYPLTGAIKQGTEAAHLLQAEVAAADEPSALRALLREAQYLLLSSESLNIYWDDCSQELIGRIEAALALDQLKEALADE
jgi:hypothetical protein